jgi:ketosteroid isomerase-like protein
MSVELIETFYKAFQKRDAEGMVACYADDVHFRDPAFGDLTGERAKGMWRMLCSRAADLEIAFRDVHSDGTTGRAHWDARYTFTQTGWCAPTEAACPTSARSVTDGITTTTVVW